MTNPESNEPGGHKWHRKTFMIHPDGWFNLRMVVLRLQRNGNEKANPSVALRYVLNRIRLTREDKLHYARLRAEGVSLDDAISTKHLAPKVSAYKKAGEEDGGDDEGDDAGLRLEGDQAGSS